MNISYIFVFLGLPFYKKQESQTSGNFPEDPPLERMVHSLIESFPQLALKNDEPNDYQSVVFGLAKSALCSALKKEKENANNSDIDDGRLFFNGKNDSTLAEKTADKVCLFKFYFLLSIS